MADLSQHWYLCIGACFELTIDISLPLHEALSATLLGDVYSTLQAVMHKI